MVKLHCENTFCIYETQNECMLDEINLDIQGNCLDCIYVNIDYETLKGAKENTHKQLSNKKL